MWKLCLSEKPKVVRQKGLVPKSGSLLLECAYIIFAERDSLSSRWFMRRWPLPPQIAFLFYRGIYLVKSRKTSHFRQIAIGFAAFWTRACSRLFYFWPENRILRGENAVFIIKFIVHCEIFAHARWLQLYVHVGIRLSLDESPLFIAVKQRAYWH
jgi:hypothetical protein